MWVLISEDKWNWQNGENVRHILHAGSGKLAELHDTWVHVYSAVGSIDNALPLENADHIETRQINETINSDEQAWNILGAAINNAESWEVMSTNEVQA